MMHIKRDINVKRVICILLFFVLINSGKYCIANQPKSIKSPKSDYVLIINSYTESSDWSNSFIYPTYEYVLENQPNTTVYTEHMNMLMITNEQEFKDYKDAIFTKYAYKKPNAIILLGNTPWALLQNEIESVWANTPVILCAEENYNGPIEAYIKKYAVPEEQKTPLIDYDGVLDLTIVYTPVYLRQNIELMKNMIPGMNKIMFLSDNRYVGAQCRADLKKILATDYPGIELENIVSNSISINQLSDTLKNASPITGILYFSWYVKNTLSGNTILTTNDYKMFSRYTNSPIFTLNDNSNGAVGMLGGYSLSNRRAKEIIDNVLETVLLGQPREINTVIDSDTPTAIINYKVLTDKGISAELCPENTIFYMKELTVWEQYKYWILFGIFFISCVFAFLIMRIGMLGKIKAKQEEKLLLVQNYSSLFDNMPIAYSKQKLVYNNKGEIIDYVVVEKNPYFEKYFTSEKNTAEKHDTEDNAFKEIVSLYGLAVSDRKEITFQYYHKMTGRYFSMIIVPSKREGYMDVFYVDNTELSSTQQLLRTLNHKLSMALEVANITPWKWDLDKGSIVCDMNRLTRGNTLETTNQDQQISVPYHLYFSKICKRDLDRVKQAYDDLLSGKINKIKEEYRVFVHEGNKRTYEWVEAQAVVDKRDERGRPISLIGSSLVISDRKKMEIDLIDAKNKAEESNRLKSAFLANMSHEIRTPLNAIVGFSEVLASAEDENEKHEYVSIIENNNTLLLQLISDILDLSKIEAGTLDFIYSDLDLDALFVELETSFKMRMKEGDVKLIYENDIENNLTINTDRSRLTQIVINMVNNAIKFTTHGSIRFGYRLQDDKTLYFYIKDTGCGIPSEKLESVFGRFVKLNNFAQGTGLGLSICQTIVHHMGGEIGVESEVDAGTTFWFTLPYNPVTIVNKQKKDIVQQVVDKNKLIVLIAEDNTSNFKLFETILKREYIIYHAWDGEEAVSMFKEYNPHIVLMDINMPKMNGYEATKQIREMSKKVPIIAVTAYAYTSDEQRVAESGFNGYAAKPINSEMLKSQMINLLKRQLIFM